MTEELEQDFTLQEVAGSLRISTRWIRDRIRLDGVAHQRYGSRIRFTKAQIEALRAMHAAQLSREPVTTGRPKSA
jgi:hypothetical protein